MAGIDAHPFILFSSQGSPAYVAPARDTSDATLDTAFVLEGATGPRGAFGSGPAIDGLGTADLALGWQAADGFRLEAEVPLHAAWNDVGSLTGFGDVRLAATTSLFVDEHRALSASPMCFLPTGAPAKGFGTGRLACGGLVAASLRASGFEATVNVGARLGPPAQVGEFRVGSGPIASAAISRGAERGAVGSLFVATHGSSGFREVPMVAGVAARVPASEDYVAISVAHGLGDAPGTPGFVVSVSFVPNPSPPPIPRAVEGRPIGATVTFEPDGDFPPDAISTLEALCRLMQEHPEVRQLRIEGHSSTTPYALEWETSRGRAVRVARWLAENGVEPERLAVQGYGSLEPAQIRLDDPRNNRVEFVIAEIEGPRRSIPVRGP